MEGQKTNSPIGEYEAPGARRHLGNPEPFVPEGPTLCEPAQFGMAHGEPGTAGHSVQERVAEALMAPLLVKECRALLKVSDRSTIVTLGLVGHAEVVVR